MPAARDELIKVSEKNLTTVCVAFVEFHLFMTFYCCYKH